MSGREIMSKTYEGNRFELNFTGYSKGVYILNILDDKGAKYNVKLIVK
ncbi:T9SS type A sorting domain-containing protein [Riemerella columbipharyngis]|nr:T9SS type A sorting domain-containing protein [Riemerella columbipharyngis]